MATVLNLSVVVQGQQNLAWPSFAIGETVNLNLTCIDPNTGNPLNLTNVVVVWTMANRFSGANVVSRQANVTNAASGLCTIPIASGDTVVSATPIAFGLYNVDCWAEDTSGNRLDLAFGQIFMAPAYRIPGAPVTPLPSQAPLGIGPPGIPIQAYSTFSAFPTPNSPNVGTFAYALDTNLLYVAENGQWNNTGSNLPPGTDGQFLGHVSGLPTWVTITQDMIGPAFAVSLTLNGVSNPLEAGASIVNPQFTDGYNQTPSVASLTGPDSVNHPISPATLTSIGYGGAANTFSAQTFTDPGTTLNQVFTWTYSATAGGITRTASASRTFERRCYFDMVAVGTYNAAFITALGSTRLQAGFATNYAFAAGDGVTQYAHLAIPTGWGNPSVFKEHVSQLPVSWSKVASGVSVTNVNSIVISYEIWRAPQANNAAFSYDVS